MRRRAALLTLVLTLCAAGIPVPAVADPVSGALGIRLLDAPVAARDDPRAAVAVVDDLDPGAVIERRVEVSNGTTDTVQVRVYATGADIADGAFVGRDAGDRSEITGWVTVSDPELTLPPGGTATPTVRIAVPRDAAAGERYGVVWAETGTAAGADGIVQVSRVGVRLYLAVDGDNPPPTRFTVSDLTAGRDADGTPTVTATVADTGGRAVDVAGTLALTDGPGGTSVAPVPAASARTIAPGQQAAVRFALDPDLPAGPWLATVTLTSGLVTETASATVTFPVAGSAAPVVARSADPGAGGGTSWSDVVWPVGGGAALALLIAGLIVVARRRAGRAG